MCSKPLGAHVGIVHSVPSAAPPCGLWWRTQPASPLYCPRTSSYKQPATEKSNCCATGNVTASVILKKLIAVTHGSCTPKLRMDLKSGWPSPHSPASPSTLLSAVLQSGTERQSSVIAHRKCHILQTTMRKDI